MEPGHYETRPAAVPGPGGEDSPGAVAALRSQFEESGLGAANTPVKAALQRRLPRGLSVEDLPPGLTDDQLAYIHDKQGGEDIAEEDEAAAGDARSAGGSTAGGSGHDTRENSLRGSTDNLLVVAGDVADDSSDTSEGTDTEAAAGDHPDIHLEAAGRASPSGSERTQSASSLAEASAEHANPGPKVKDLRRMFSDQAHETTGVAAAQMIEDAVRTTLGQAGHVATGALAMDARAAGEEEAVTKM